MLLLRNPGRYRRLPVPSAQNCQIKSVKLPGGLVGALLAAGATVTPVTAAPRASEASGDPAPPASSKPGGSVALTVRRSSDALQLVIEGAGPAPVLYQTRSGDVWRGDLRLGSPGALRVGPQRLSLPEAGLQTVSFQGSGSDYQIQVVPMPGAPLSRPVVSADGQNLILSFAAPPQQIEQKARFNLRQPGMIPQPSYAPPIRPRAVAPPLGDMAVSSATLQNPSFVRISGPRVTITLKDAPAKDALMLLARIGGYGFVMIDEKEPDKSVYQFDYDDQDVKARERRGKVSAGSRPVTVSFVDEKYDVAVNSVLMSAGLQGRLEGRVLLAGLSASSKSFGPVISKTFRLNQASSPSAAKYLNSLGASVAFPGYVGALGVFDVDKAVQDESKDGKQGSNQDENYRSISKITQADSYSPGIGPLVGLAGTTDPRLQTITLIGSSAVVSLAEQYLRMIDLRQRQVALSIKILDVTLDNSADITNSFAFRYGNNFIVSDEGRMVGAFNSYTPPGTVTDSALPPPSFNSIAGGASPARNPGLAYDQNNFYDFLRASIESRSTKVLASPTLILSENAEGIGGKVQVAEIGSAGLGSAQIGRPSANESFVTVGEQIIINYQVQAGQNGAPNTCQPELGIAGLTFGARVSRIDDNGFVTFTMSPQISAATRRQDVGGCGPIDILSIRRLDTGSARVRDGQTLVMTGVITDADQAAVTKWPVLGDIPLIGQFFRASSKQSQRRELVILVTPRIIDDERGGVYGYGYLPGGQDSRRFLGAYGGGN